MKNKEVNKKGGCVKMHINNLTTFKSISRALLKAKKRPFLYSKSSTEMVIFYWIVSNCKIIKMIFAFWHTLFVVFVTPNKEKWAYENASELYAPDWELSFNVRISTQTILSEVVKVVQVNNAIDVRIARSILLATTHTKPIFLTLLTDQSGIGQSQHDTNVGHYDLSAFILVYSQEILLVVLLVVAVW